MLIGVGSAALPLEEPFDVLSKEETFHFSEPQKEEATLSITVVGASGDLAKKKIFPALFALYYEDCLPQVWFFPQCVS